MRKRRDFSSGFGIQFSLWELENGKQKTEVRISEDFAVW
jgi:hypothetical protein